jgi:hypothetical protein
MKAGIFLHSNISLLYSAESSLQQVLKMDMQWDLIIRLIFLDRRGAAFQLLN